MFLIIIKTEAICLPVVLLYLSEPQPWEGQSPCPPASNEQEVNKCADRLVQLEVEKVKYEARCIHSTMDSYCSAQC